MPKLPRWYAIIGFSEDCLANISHNPLRNGREGVTVSADSAEKRVKSANLKLPRQF